MVSRAVCLTVAFAMGFMLIGGPWAGPAVACSCATAPLEGEIERSDAVFSGEVRSIDEGATPGGPDEETTLGGFGAATGKVSLVVRGSWKGVTAETVEVYGQGDGVNCYNLFEEGRSYLVYASRGERTGAAPAPLENIECGATKPLAAAEKDLRLLGSPAGLTETGGPSLLFAGVLVAMAGFWISCGVLRRWIRS